MTMMEEHFHRAYRAGGADLNSGLASLFDGIGRSLSDSLRVLHRIEWSAPWAVSEKNRQCN